MELKDLRKKIDLIDSEILELVNKRTDYALKIGSIKKSKGMDTYAPNRENEIIERIVKLNKGPFPDAGLTAVYRELMSATRFLERPIKVAYMGPEATFSHLAALKKFGQSVNYVPVKTIKDVFEEVERKRVDYGVVPIENSIEGVINYTLDMFVESNLKIYGEILLEVSLNLLSNFPMKSIKKIFSHPQPYAQSRNWLENNLPGVPLIETVSTTQAALMAQKNNWSAAIASELAGQMYGLKTIAGNIEDYPHNFTRFLVIKDSCCEKTGHDKTSIVFSVKDKVGALHSILAPFARYKINLTKIESRPSRKKAWDYIFFVDFQGHKDEEKASLCLSKVHDQCNFLKILGSYPDAKIR
ncbi:MAG: prephenate dehydratase [bacterium]